MSKQAQYEIKLKEVNEENLKEAVGRMAKELDIPIMNKRKFKIGLHSEPVRGTCIKLTNAHYAADIYANDNEIVINTDSDNLSEYRAYQNRIKQFYEATEISKEFNTEYDYNKETEKIEMKIYA